MNGKALVEGAQAIQQGDGSDPLVTVLMVAVAALACAVVALWRQTRSQEQRLHEACQRFADAVNESTTVIARLTERLR